MIHLSEPQAIPPKNEESAQKLNGKPRLFRLWAFF